jgi:putative transposase
MLKTFKYRLYPTKNQCSKLEQTLEACRMTYNGFLTERKKAWEERQENIGHYQQCKNLISLKEQYPFLNKIHSQVLQNVALRVDLAYKAFFRRCKSGEKVGYPRFKGFGNYDSITFPQVQNGGCNIVDGKLKVSKIGHIKIKQHRLIEGIIKTATITRTRTNKWFVCFSCEIEKIKQRKNDKAVGIDVGISSFAYLSDGTKISNPKFIRKEEKELARVQRKLSKQDKGTPERKKAKLIVARVYERITNKRKDFTHKESRKIINKYGYIFIEDLNVNRMVHNHCLAKSILDVAWTDFFNKLSYKAENADKTLVKVNPAYTSQTCSKCGHRQKMPLSERMFKCPCCHISLHRDYNASLNILSLGQQALANT